jgi:simple sugar transport system permease protein
MPRWFDALGSRLNRINSVVLTLLAVVSALVVGVFVIVLSDVEALQSGDFGRAFSEVANAYKALVTGSVGSLRAISDTINNATPFIITGVSVAVAFRAGLFNIGATGQMIAGGTTATWVGFAMDGPGIVQIPLALLAGILGGAAFGAIPGVLKARTGAHEVITTIMLNYIASFMLLWLLTTDLFQRPERTDPISKFVSDASRLPTLFGFMEGRADLTAHSGILLALLVVVLFWWFLERSKMGFEFRAFGMQPNMRACVPSGLRCSAWWSRAVSRAWLAQSKSSAGMAMPRRVSPARSALTQLRSRCSVGRRRSVHCSQPCSSARCSQVGARCRRPPRCRSISSWCCGP